MENLDSFIKTKLKSKKMKIDTFIKKTEMSKSTIYRVMKGYQRPSDELVEKIAEILNLNQLEKRELIYYSKLTDIDEGVLSARNAVSKLLYETRINSDEKVEFVYYDKEKYVKFFDDILNSMYSVADREGFFCRLRIINCARESVILSILEAAKKLYESESLLGKKNTYSIEHLINLSTYDASANIDLLGEIMPLLSADNYSLYYCDTSGVGEYSFFNDFIMLDYGYKDETGEEINKHLYMSILEDNLSACYVADDNKNLREFFDRNFESLSRHYKSAVDKKKNFDFLGNVLEQLERKYDCYLFKPNPYYNRIPMEVYHSIRDRLPMEAISIFRKSVDLLKDDSISDEMSVEVILDYLQRRIDSSHVNNQIDIFTKKGLKEFAMSGKLSDHLQELPGLTKEERKIVLENIRDRHMDKSDKYKFYIINEDCDSDFVLTVFKGYGLLIEYNAKYRVANYNPYCFIEHVGLSDIFCEFATNYVPTMITMADKDSIRFINELISEYCQ